MKSDRLQIRIAPDIKAILQQLADAEGRSVSNYIERLILAAEAAKNTDGRQNNMADKQCDATHQDNIDAIPGLKQIRAAHADLSAWHAELNASFDDCGGLGVRPKPQYDFAAMYAQHPRAAAYLTAEAYACAANRAKAAAGKRALDAIISGADCDATLAAMRKEWEDYCAEHMWD